MTGSMVRLRTLLVRAAFGVARHLPLRHRVVLATAHADELGGNLASIRDELARRRPPVPFVVLAQSTPVGWRGRVAAAWGAVLAGYHLATATVFVVDDYFFPIYVIRPRRGTTIVQTWHGSGAFKKFGYSVLDKTFGADEALTGQVRIHSNYDVCLVSSMSVAPHFAEAYRQPIERFRADLGIPRTDVLFGEERIAADLASRSGGATRSPTVGASSCTPRRSAASGSPRPATPTTSTCGSCASDSATTTSCSSGSTRSSGRAPPLGPELGGFAIDVSDHPDINELLLVSDVLVTDYSSVIYEFALLGRPIVFFAPDHEAYERERGFYFDYRTGVPGPIFEETAALADYLRAGQFDLERVAAFGAASFDVADGALDGAIRRTGSSCRPSDEGAVRYAPRPPRRPPAMPTTPTGSTRHMTFRAKPVVKRSHRPSWESQDRRNFYLNLGFGLVVVAASSSW